MVTTVYRQGLEVEVLDGNTLTIKYVSTVSERYRVRIFHVSLVLDHELSFIGVGLGFKGPRAFRETCFTLIDIV
jgi:hypothetical protein